MPIAQLSRIAVPPWLTELSPTTMMNGEFPLRELLKDSLYYPCSGLDGDPVKHLAGNIVSFVYADYGNDRDTVLNDLTNKGFSGYEPLAIRSVTERELAPHGWLPVPPTDHDGRPSSVSDWVQKPFCIWCVFQRQEGFAADYGPSRFSLLYICGDGVATFQAIYNTNAVAPRAVAVIQPGHGILGGNWTDLTDPEKIFARSVRDNPAGLPEVLLYGGFGNCQYYQEPCWPAYQTNLYFYKKYRLNGGCVGIWSQDPR